MHTIAIDDSIDSVCPFGSDQFQIINYYRFLLVRSVYHVQFMPWGGGGLGGHLESFSEFLT